MWVLITLAELLRKEGEEQILAMLGQFKCSKNADLQDFLHNKAVDYERKDRSRTFLLVANGRVKAFFSLALFQKSVDFRQNTTFIIVGIAKNPRIYGEMP